MQFNENFIKNKLNPTLKTLLTRIGQPTDAETKGSYLGKLLISQKLNAEEKNRFNNEYFLGAQPQDRAFTSEDEEKYREILLEQMTIYINQQKIIFGEEGIRNILIPTEEKNFENSDLLDRSLNKMARRLVSDFEKYKVVEFKDSFNKDEIEKLQNGEMIVFSDDGEDKVINYSEVSGENDSKELNQINENRLESVKSELESAGLEVEQLEIRGNQFVGYVKDVNNQSLYVEIDSSLKNDNPRKIKITIKEQVVNKKSIRSFFISQSDLQKNFLQNGQRVSAEDVYEKLPESAKFKDFEIIRDFNFGESEEPHLTPKHGSIRKEKSIEDKNDLSESKIKGEQSFEIVPDQRLLIGGAVEDAKKSEHLLKFKEGSSQRRADSNISRRITRKSKQTESEQQDQISEQEYHDSQLEQYSQLEQPKPVINRVGSQDIEEQYRIKRKNDEKAHKRTMKIIAGSSAGVVAASPGIALLAKMFGMSDSDSILSRLSFVVDCIGNICIS